MSDVHQYKDASNLDARIALHSRFSTAKVDWYEWLFGHFSLPEGAGCSRSVVVPANSGVRT